MKISVSDLAGFQHFRHDSAGVGTEFGGAVHRQFCDQERRLSVRLSVDGMRVMVNGVADAVTTSPLSVTELKIVNEVQAERKAYAADQAAMYAYMLAVEQGAAEITARVRFLSPDGETLYEKAEIYTVDQLAEKFRALLVPYVRWVRKVWAKHPQEAPLSPVRGQGLMVPKLGEDKAVLAYRLGVLAQSGKTTLADLGKQLDMTSPSVRRLLKRIGMEIDRNGKERAPGYLVFSKPSVPGTVPDASKDACTNHLEGMDVVSTSVNRPLTVRSNACIINTICPNKRYRELSEWVASIYPETSFWKWTGPAIAEYASWLEAHLSPDECGLFRWAVENYLYTQPGEYLKNPFKFVAVQDGDFVRRCWRTYAERPDEFRSKHDRAVDDREKEREFNLKNIAYNAQMKRVAYQLGKQRAEGFKHGGKLLAKPERNPKPELEPEPEKGRVVFNPLKVLTEDKAVIRMWDEDPPKNIEALESLARRICEITPIGSEWWDVTDDRFVDLVVVLMHEIDISA